MQHAACMTEVRISHCIKLVGNLKEREHLGNLGVDGRTLKTCLQTIGCENVDFIHGTGISGGPF
jgi:hypothetical protein